MSDTKASVTMVPCSEYLPPPFVEVLVYGLCPHHDKYNYGFYVARRWTGTWPPPKDEDYQWLTHCDAQVTKVVCWMVIPHIPREQP